eukprot:GHVQ01007106.1.p1 GENE.GHVQ01007106.1~~GHVQ01007106.1.p1  ORF type:complete len:142 (-),score=19.73 GHVQ01007106.1:55-480(-)
MSSSQSHSVNHLMSRCIPMIEKLIQQRSAQRLPPPPPTPSNDTTTYHTPQTQTILPWDKWRPRELVDEYRNRELKKSSLLNKSLQMKKQKIIKRKSFGTKVGLLLSGHRGIEFDRGLPQSKHIHRYYQTAQGTVAVTEWIY